MKEPDKPEIRILHLSDLQSGNENTWWRFDNSFYEMLHEALASSPNPGPIRSILVTGDVAEKGKAQEYEEAYNFIARLRHALEKQWKVDVSVFIVPGNHDIDRGADEKAEKGSMADRDRFAKKLEAYNAFVKRFGRSLETTYEKPFVVGKIKSGDLRINVVGLNSCIRESHKPSDHYGWIGINQLDELSVYLKDEQVSPYHLLIAAFHHNPLMLGHVTEDQLEEAFKSLDEVWNDNGVKHGDRDKAAIEILAALRNYLHESEMVLERLVKQGFSIVLHGHQHFDGIRSVNFGGKRGEPFRRSSIALMGAGSAGLRKGVDEQPSVASAQVLTFSEVPWGWRVESERLTIGVTGRVCPHISISLDVPRAFNIPRGEPLEPIKALSDSFCLSRSLMPGNSEPEPKEDQPNEAEEFLDSCVLWQANELDAQVKGCDLAGQSEAKAVDESMLNDLRAVYLYGVRRWTEGKKLYGNDLMLAIRKVHVGPDNKLSVGLRVEPYAQTLMVNWGLPCCILDGGTDGARISFRKKHLVPLLQKYKDDKNTNELADLVERFPFLCGRSEVNVLATVMRPNGRHLLVQKRSRDVAIQQGAFQPFTAGGCRLEPSAEVFNWIGVEQVQKVLRHSALQEIERETGILLGDVPLHLVALYLNPLLFTSVWLYWVDLQEQTYGELLEGSKIVHRGRDKWETVKEVEGLNIDKRTSFETIEEKLNAPMSDDLRFGLRLLLQSSVWRNRSASRSREPRAVTTS